MHDMEIMLPLVCLLCATFLCNWCTVFGWNAKEMARTRIDHRKTCVFPSVHRRAAIYECQHSSWSVPTETFHSKRPIWWCPLTDNFDHYPEWIVCPETSSTYGGNQPGQECHFPFVYQKQLHTTCLRKGGDLVFNHSQDPVPIDTGQSGYWWCSTTPNFDRDGKWTRCRPQLAQQLPCHFSKASLWAGGMVSGIAHECQAFAGHWICITELGQLRECPARVDSTVSNPPSTEGGNNPGRGCHFPFQATLPLLNNKQLIWTGPMRKRNFTACIPGTPNPPSIFSELYPPWIGFWCATTDNFDRDRLWTRCAIEPYQIPYIHDIPTSRINSNLVTIWTQLGWFQQLSVEERSRLTGRTQAFSPEFEQSLRLVEAQRAQWDVTISDENSNWWVWLAPFWWASYSANQTPATTTAPNRFEMETTPDTLPVGSVSPLSRGFQLPSWVDAWSSAGWLEFGLSMNERWTKLASTVHARWSKAWIMAFLTGFASALGIVFGIILLIAICLDENKRRELIFIFCGQKRNKRSLAGNMDSSSDEANCVLFASLNGGPPKYPCPIVDEYCVRRAIHNEADEHDVSKHELVKFPRVDENCIMTDNSLWFSLNPNTDPLVPKRHPSITTQSMGRPHSAGIPYDSPVLGKSDYIHRSELTCPCWSARDLSCLRYQQQLNHALELIVSLIRNSENQDELCKSADLRHQLHQLLSSRPVLGANGAYATAFPNTHNSKAVTCACTTNHRSLLHTAENSVMPSAPPPSYEQLTD